MDTFLAVFESLPRQGPGGREWTARALAMCEDLPSEPVIVDLGCGSGAQTIDLAELTDGTIVAADNHPPFLEMLARRAAARGLSQRIETLVMDLANSGLRARCADLVWSEGALYNLGMSAALALCHHLVRPGGYVAFTDAVWLTEEVPASVRAVFAEEYPTMGNAAGVLVHVTAAGFDVVGHFTLPDDAWWDTFYTPMRARIAELRPTCAADPDALAVLDLCDAEIDMFRDHADCYGYEFFVARRPMS